MGRFVHPDLKDVSLSVVLHALADPTRRAILRSLRSDKECGGAGLACQAAAPADVPKATMSHHYAVLRAAGLVRAEKHGVEVRHTTRCEEVEVRFPGLMAAVLVAEDANADAKPS
jgi:DNA-binding transcriptional ArsR family regulator